MTLIVLPTLDGSKEAAIARLEALDQREYLNRIDQGLWYLASIVNDVATSDGYDDYDQVAHLRAEAEAVTEAIQYDVERLVAS